MTECFTGIRFLKKFKHIAPPVYLHANGVTFIAEDFAPNGLVKSDVGNGDEWFYIAEDRADLKSKTGFWDDANSPTEQSIDGQLISADRIVTTRVNNLFALFSGTAFNQPIGTWDTSSVTNMGSTFLNSQFNQPIGAWDTSSVIHLFGMFRQAKYDHPLDKWDTSSAVNMNFMFHNSKLNQDLSSWCVSQFTNMPAGFALNTPQWTLPKPVWGTCP